MMILDNLAPFLRIVEKGGIGGGRPRTRSLPGFGVGAANGARALLWARHCGHARPGRLADRRGQMDFAVRHGLLADSSLHARSLGENRRIVCAAPVYLAANGTLGRIELGILVLA